MSFSNLYIGVAFHGVELTGEQLEVVYDRLLDWQTRTGSMPPTHGDASGPGFTDRIITFKALTSRLKKTGLKRLCGFELYTLRANGESPLWQHSIQSHLSNEYRCIVFSANSSSTSLSLDGELFEITRTLLSLAAPRYGYGFVRDNSIAGPFGGTALCYGIGIPVGYSSLDYRSLNREERDEVRFLQEWRLHVEKLQLYDKGILRDLYPWNFLNDPQLARKVERKQLRNWIAADPARGELRDIDGPLQLWTLTEKQIAHVRPALRDAGILFDWREYRDL